ncbi:vesicle transport protein SFT2B isoform X2 [Mangifera indica]|uniref:vesicle transport protein SFT2B isoform X2 n=1 Tax=Mangifera indica TaxID=29780 RepID=UPI001CFA7F65|nr:vesicle transport protein SFT2B isoform X2 [Mangifera indica]
MEKVNHAFEKVKMLVGIEVEDEESEGAAASENSSSFAFMDDFNRQCTLSTKQSLLVFFNPIKFGITFTFGNLLSLGSTAFLIGPKRQVTMMLDPVRIYATALYLASIIIALFCALYVHNKLLTLIAIILEFGALIWYSLSYIPFARTMVSKVMVACFDTEF